MFGKLDTIERKVPEPALFTEVDGTGATVAGVIAAADYSMTLRDRIVHIYASGATSAAAYAITLPNVGEAAGQVFAFTTVEDLSTYNVTLQDQDESMDWVDVLLLGVNSETLLLFSDGLKWHILSENVSSLHALDLIATYQVLPSDNGKTFFLNAAAEFTTTLPSIADVGPGFKVTFIIKAAPVGADYVITEYATDDTNIIIVNGIVELEVDTNNDGPSSTGCTFLTSISGATLGKAGDRVVFESDGTNWFCHGQSILDGGWTAT